MEKKGTKETPARPTDEIYFKRTDMVRVLDPKDEYNLRSGLVTEIYEHGNLIEVKFIDDVRKKYRVDQLKIVTSATMRPKAEESSHQATDRELNEDWEKYLDARGTEAN